MAETVNWFTILVTDLLALITNSVVFVCPAGTSPMNFDVSVEMSLFDVSAFSFTKTPMAEPLPLLVMETVTFPFSSASKIPLPLGSTKTTDIVKSGRTTAFFPTITGAAAMSLVGPKGKREPVIGWMATMLK